ncbi:MAG TPA: T9SS type A sorting domain-containing protein, partial [Rhodothermales bacterium]|nr:T9SS type A sorting domain-containing protein [Rhodothermales bacterium]
LQVYRDAMPGYTVEGFTSSGANAWLSTDALHCRVKEVPDRGMLSLLHDPPAPEVPYQAELALDVDVIAYSGQPLTADELYLIYRTDTAPFDTLALHHVTGDTYSASVPVSAAGAELTYYFSAADGSGRTERFPLVGPLGARHVTVLPAVVAAEPAATAAGLRLEEVAPNPSAGGVSVGYALDAPGPVTLEVLDLLGRRVAVLHEGPAAAGTHRARWEPNGSPAGVYVVRLSGGGEQAVRRVTLIR